MKKSEKSDKEWQTSKKKDIDLSKKVKIKLKK